MLLSLPSSWFVRREVTPQSFRLLITLPYPNNIWCFRLVLTLFGLYIHHIDMHGWFEKCKHKCKSDVAHQPAKMVLRCFLLVWWRFSRRGTANDDKITVLKGINTFIIQMPSRYRMLSAFIPFSLCASGKFITKENAPGEMFRVFYMKAHDKAPSTPEFYCTCVLYAVA